MDRDPGIVTPNSSVAMETCFGQLGLYLENYNSCTFKYNSI